MILVGDCLEQLQLLPDDSVDAMITDPPAGIAFMGKNWDKDKGGRDLWIKWFYERMYEAFRVLKPGAHILVWALPRTSHWPATAIEDAGFDIRDRVSHLFGTGFPKAANISKQIDKAAGAERKVVGKNPNHRAESGVNYEGTYAGGNTGAKDITESSTAEAKQWEGWATALKPACEDWWLCRKPFKGSAYKNVLKYGTGALNIDASRITGEPRSTGHKGGQADSGENGVYGSHSRPNQQRDYDANKPPGRWPAHVVFSHSPDCQPNGTKVEKGHKGYPKGPGGKSVHWGEGTKRSDECRTEAWEGIPDQEVVAWECVEECAVLTLDTQTGVLTSGAVTSSSAGSNFGYGGGASGYKGDHPASSGGASRFFYCAKPAQKEKNAGLDNKNPHPTVKSVKLMRWLIRLITPPGGVVLDPFCGSGSTGIACIEEGFDFIGIEQSEEYATVAAGRIEYAERQKRISEVKAEREARHE